MHDRPAGESSFVVADWLIAVLIVVVAALSGLTAADGVAPSWAIPLAFAAVLMLLLRRATQFHRH